MSGRPGMTGRFRTLHSRISISTALVGVLVFTITLGTNYFLSRALLEQYISGLAISTAGSAAARVNSVFTSVSGSANSLAELVEVAHVSEPQIHSAIKAFIESNREIFGMTVALEPHVLDQAIGEFSPYYHRRGEDQLFTDLAVDEYSYRDWGWYRQPKKSGRPLWTEPYFDEGGGNVLMTTYGRPVYTQDGQFAGVVTADVALDWLQVLVDDIHIGETGYGIIVSGEDVIVAHPDRSKNMRSVAEFASALSDREDLYQYLRTLDNDKAHYMKAPCWKAEDTCWLAVEPLAGTGWEVWIVVPESELEKDVLQLTFKILLLAVLGLMVLVFTIIFITRRLTRPLVELTKATESIGSGNLELNLPTAIHHDEIGVLTGDFSKMLDSLKVHIQQLKESTARQQKLQSEIEIARDIQMSMVPGNGSVSESYDTYGIYSLLRPARSVGGDLYYFRQTGNLLHFLLGDVSDKGIPAALFMAKTVTLYTSALADNLSPGRILSQLNDALTDANDACMFVTALCGQLNLDDGSLVIANAGHMNPFIVSGGTIEELVVDGSLALGLMENMVYPDVDSQLKAKDSLVMYTDGISEALNPTREQFGEHRLLVSMEKVSMEKASSTTPRSTTPEEIGIGIMSDLANFVSTAEQSDDITLMVVQYGM